jgi:hypothetical protein
MKPVVHTVDEYSIVTTPWAIPNPTVCAPYGIVTYTVPPVGCYLAKTRWWVASNPQAAFRAATYGYPTSTDCSVGHYDRWLKVKPTMVTRASMTVFLAELREIHKLFDYIPRKHFNLRNWNELLKWANSLHLNWNFGWKPFLADLDAVFRGLHDFESRLHRFIESADLDLVRHGGDSPVTESLTSSTFACSSETSMWYKATGTRTIKRFSTFQFSYTLPRYSYETLRWRAYLDTLGLAATASNVWELIPWSFVIDWFADFGSFLRSTEDDWVQPWLYFCQACSSYKVEQEVNFHLQYQGWHKPWFNDFATWRYKQYQRALGAPNHDDLSASSLSLDKIRLLASLAAQQLL